VATSYPPSGMSRLRIWLVVVPLLVVGRVFAVLPLLVFTVQRPAVGSVSEVTGTDHAAHAP